MSMAPQKFLSEFPDTVINQERVGLPLLFITHLGRERSSGIKVIRALGTRVPGAIEGT
jgi:hypothetical protein